MKENHKSLSRLNWTAQVQVSLIKEELFLRIQREQNGLNNWTVISKELNKAFNDRNRSGKQCRERYMNYARFSENFDINLKWTLEEDERLFKNFLLYGRKWVQICKNMPNRSQNCVKNRFYGAIRKICRGMRKVMKQNRIKQKYLKNQDTYFEILEFTLESAKLCTRNYENFLKLIAKLKKELIQIALAPEEEIKGDKISCVIEQIHLFISQKKHFSQKTTDQKCLSSSSTCKIRPHPIHSQEKQNLQQLATVHDSTLSPLFKYELQPSVFSLKFTQEIGYNFQELGLFLYEPSSVCDKQDLEREVSEILNKEVQESHFCFL